MSRRVRAAPVVSFVDPPNTPLTDGGTVTVTGLNFRVADFTNSAEFDRLQCMTASWSSKTTATCHVAVSWHTGSISNIAVTAAAAVGSRTAVFSFDGDALCRIFVGCGLFTRSCPSACGQLPRR